VVQIASTNWVFTTSVHPRWTLFKSGTVHRWNLNPMPMGMDSGTKKQFSKYTMKVPPTSTTAKVSGTVVLIGNTNQVFTTSVHPNWN
jgi:hypothetical protein